MTKIELLFPADLEDITVITALSGKDSGFERDKRRPLDSGFEIGLNVAGLLIGAGQLAIAIWSLLLQYQQQTGKPISGLPPIKLRQADGAETTLPTESLTSLTKTLESISKDKAGDSK